MHYAALVITNQNNVESTGTIEDEVRLLMKPHEKRFDYWAFGGRFSGNIEGKQLYTGMAGRVHKLDKGEDIMPAMTKLLEEEGANDGKTVGCKNSEDMTFVGEILAAGEFVPGLIVLPDATLRELPTDAMVYSTMEGILRKTGQINEHHDNDVAGRESLMTWQGEAEKIMKPYFENVAVLVDVHE